METVKLVARIITNKLPDDMFALFSHKNLLSIYIRGSHMVAVIKLGPKTGLVKGVYAKRKYADMVAGMLQDERIVLDRPVQEAIDSWKKGRTLATSDFDNI